MTVRTSFTLRPGFSAYEWIAGLMQVKVWPDVNVKRARLART
jgi:hypothetical protein